MARALFASTALTLAFVTLQPRQAAATGMQGHIWSSQCAHEMLPSGRLKTLLDGQKLRLDNGSFFPDSGYAAKHEYGETAHWEQFVEGYVQWLRKKSSKPADDPTLAPHAAFLLGAASHGLVDQTFDILFMDKVAEVDGPTDELDTSMDVFLAQKRKYLPDLSYDANDLVEVFGKYVSLTVPAEKIKNGMDIARAGQGLVAEILWKSADERGKRYPWARARYQDPRVPGSYPWGARAVVGYWENILRRLDGDASAEALVVATDPAPNGTLRGLRVGKVDAYLTLFVGQGLVAESITDASFFVKDASGTVVPTEIRVRGDKWKTTLQLKPKSDWKADAKYTLVLDATIATLSGTKPSKAFELPFTTPCATCESKYADPIPASPCPKTLSDHPRLEDVEEPSDAGANPAVPAPAANASGCSCSMPARAGGGLGASSLALAAGFAIRRRRSRRC